MAPSKKYLRLAAYGGVGAGCIYLASVGVNAFFNSSYGQQLKSTIQTWWNDENGQKHAYSLVKMCEICKEDIKDGNEIILNCMHSFHYSCHMILQREGQNKCPVCLKKFND